jgi:hypothetical protein
MQSRLSDGIGAVNFLACLRPEGEGLVVEIVAVLHEVQAVVIENTILNAPKNAILLIDIVLYLGKGSRCEESMNMG